MVFRRLLLRLVYPLFAKLSGKGKNGKIYVNEKKQQSLRSFYTLEAIDNNNELINFSAYKGKNVLIVNTASDCGYTPQYAELEELQRSQTDKLVILAFPSNDFKQQEQGSDEDIAAFCRVNYGITFPVIRKSVVVPGEAQHPVYQWLTQPVQNGWNDHAPDWNFGKYLINKEGMLTHYFGPAIAPSEILNLL